MSWRRILCLLSAAVSLSVAMLRSAEPKPAADGMLVAPVNEYRGMQERQEVFEFTQKPAVKNEGGKWFITFASKGACDATLSIVAKDGKVIRHLASGVLGKNAPSPFQQNSLAQRLEWDGQDDMGKPAPAGCTVKVGLGVKAKFERSIGWHPHALYSHERENKVKAWTATGKDGNSYVSVAVGRGEEWTGRVYDKDGNYVRTFWPPPAADMEKYLDQYTDHNAFLGKVKLATTIWGDKTIAAARYGPFQSSKCVETVIARASGGAKAQLGELPPAITAKVPRPYQFTDAKAFQGGPLGLFEKYAGQFSISRLVVDRYREEIYVGGYNNFGSAGFSFLRINGKTGELDKSWFPNGEFNHLSDGYIGPDGLLYVRVGDFSYGQWIVRVDHNGKAVPFGGDACDLPEYQKKNQFADGVPGTFSIPNALRNKPLKGLWVGLVAHSNVQERGLYVSPRGTIAAAVFMMYAPWAKKHGLPADAPVRGQIVEGANVAVWTNEGKLLTANAVGDTVNGHGVAMDRDGNVYAATVHLPTVKGTPSKFDGITQYFEPETWGGMGTLMKYRGQGGKFPLGTTTYPAKGTPAPAGGLVFTRDAKTERVMHGALWAYPGLVAQINDCSCHNVRYDMDYYARHWLVGNQLHSVVVLDANGNRIARLGRYGNVDDTDKDIKAGKDGLRFAWMKAVAVSESALYVVDIYNRRILKAALTYAAEETVPLTK